MIRVTRTEDKQFPIVVKLNGTTQRFTEAAARELSDKLGAIVLQGMMHEIKDSQDSA